jgi:hypothetical protein
VGVGLDYSQVTFKYTIDKVYHGLALSPTCVLENVVVNQTNVNQKWYSRKKKKKAKTEIPQPKNVTLKIRG